MRRTLLLGLLLLASCSDDSGGSSQIDAPVVVTDGGAETGADAVSTADGTPAAPSRLERPTDLPRPPIDRLPADLFPPGR